MNLQRPTTVRVVPATAAQHAALLDLRVLPEQRAWVGVIANALADLAQSPGSDSMAIWRDDTLVGHYRIDPHARSIAGHDFPVPTLGLRVFFIDARAQGQGIGSAALQAMFIDLATRYPDARQLALGVSADNAAALRLYTRAGFVDGGELYHGGRAGAQHLLLRPLP